MKSTLELCGSRLEILIDDQWEFSDLIQECFKIWIDFENKYSRFISWNFLSELNKNKISKIDKEFLSIIQLCLKTSHITDWYFDITVQPILENLGYWIEKNENINYNIWYKNIIISDTSIELKNNISIDLWSVWKWYIVDKIYNVLDSKVDKFSINFWWDIRVKSEQEVKLEDPNDTEKIIWEVTLINSSISSSSWNKRIFWKSHHLIDPKNKISQNNIEIVYITHKLAIFSDIFATALFVSPLDKSLDILASIKWLEWMIITKAWKIYKSKWFDFKN